MIIQENRQAVQSIFYIDTFSIKYFLPFDWKKYSIFLARLDFKNKISSRMIAEAAGQINISRKKCLPFEISFEQAEDCFY